MSPWSLMVIGVAAGIAGGLHYLQDMSSLPRGHASWAQLSMLYGGGIAFLAGLIALNLVAVLRGRWKPLLADVVAFAGCLLLGFVVFGQDPKSWRSAETWVWGIITVLGLGAAIGGFGWLLHILWRDTRLGLRSWIVLTVAAGVFLMIGLTPMDRVEVPMPLLIMITL
ncbi:MAG: hypothetical protein JJ992_22525, partial [Planctomycetes bacterium]|nr:hypothetical protein [Planctomycetota bacterium]